MQTLLFDFIDMQPAIIMGFAHVLATFVLVHPTTNYAVMHNYRRGIHHSTCKDYFQIFISILIFIFLLIYWALIGNSFSVFYPTGFSRLNLGYRVQNNGNFSVLLGYLGTTGGGCDNVNVHCHIPALNNLPLVPGFFGIKGNFTKFSIFKAFFVFFYLSMTSVALSKGYYSYF